MSKIVVETGASKELVKQANTEVAAIAKERYAKNKDKKNHASYPEVVAKVWKEQAKIPGTAASELKQNKKSGPTKSSKGKSKKEPSKTEVRSLKAVEKAIVKVEKAVASAHKAVDSAKKAPKKAASKKSSKKKSKAKE